MFRTVMQGPAVDRFRPQPNWHFAPAITLLKNLKDNTLTQKNILAGVEYEIE